MRIEDVKIRMYVANDGTEFYSQRECEEYEKSLMPFVVKPEWIERHQKQVVENEKVKVIISEFMEQGKRYVLTDMYLELLPQLDFQEHRTIFLAVLFKSHTELSYTPSRQRVDVRRLP